MKDEIKKLKSEEGERAVNKLKDKLSFTLLDFSHDKQQLTNNIK